jgi:hypothetical protein
MLDAGYLVLVGENNLRPVSGGFAKILNEWILTALR